MASKVEATNASNRVEHPAGQRLQCRSCGSEIEILNPCTCQPSTLTLTCCGKPMTPTTAGNVHLGVE